MKTCPTCHISSPLGAFVWSQSEDELWLAAEICWFPLDLQCCVVCNELAREAKAAANVVHDVWQSHCLSSAREPASQAEFALREHLHPFFKNNREGWVDDYTGVAVAWAAAATEESVNEVAAWWTVVVAGDDIKATIYFRELLWMVTELSLEEGEGEYHGASPDDESVEW